MAYTSEIEKLEKRWAENPKGRNFAPLADAYRKAGELDRALELCQAGLELHPDYVSAHIVHARCLIDQKNDARASEVFQRVLALDPENVLALKILAEIAERGGRFDQAVEWLGRLLAADPMNGDAAEALARAKVKAAQPATHVATPTPAPKSAEPVVRLVAETVRTAARPAPRPAPARPPSGPQRAVSPSRATVSPAPPPPPAPGGRPDFVVEHASDAPTSPTLDVKGTPSDIETFDGTIDFNAVAHDAAKADGIEVQEEVELKPQDLVVEGLAHTQYEGGSFTRPVEEELEEGFAKIDLPLIMPDEAPETVPAPAPFVSDVARAPTPAAAAPIRPAPPPRPRPPQRPHHRPRRRRRSHCPTMTARQTRPRCRARNPCSRRRWRSCTYGKGIKRTRCVCIGRSWPSVRRMRGCGRESSRSRQAEDGVRGGGERAKPCRPS